MAPIRPNIETPVEVRITNESGEERIEYASIEEPGKEFLEVEANFILDEDIPELERPSLAAKGGKQFGSFSETLGRHFGKDSIENYQNAKRQAELV
jgi:hypothetical protein